MSMLSHLKIAVTTNGLTQVDANFAGAKNMVFYNVSQDSSQFIDIVQFKGNGASKKSEKAKAANAAVTGKNGGCCMMDADDEQSADGIDPLTAKVESLKGCAVLFTKGIGDPAAMRVQDEKVFPVKMDSVRDIDEVILSLQRMMSSTLPPLWLRRALGYIEQDIPGCAEA